MVELVRVQRIKAVSFEYLVEGITDSLGHRCGSNFIENEIPFDTIFERHGRAFASAETVRPSCTG